MQNTSGFTSPEHDNAPTTHVAVCVTGQRGCDRLIRAGRSLADTLNAQLTVMSAMPRMQSESTGDVLEYLFDCSRRADAEMLVLYTDKPLEVLAAQLRGRNTTHVVLGMPGQFSSQMGPLLTAKYRDAKYYVCDETGRLHAELPPAERAL